MNGHAQPATLPLLGQCPEAHLPEERDPKSVLVVTDLEPDDLVAILLLLRSRSIPHERIEFLIVGWSDVQSKCVYMLRFLREFAPDSHPVIYQGSPSEKERLLPQMSRTKKEKDEEDDELHDKDIPFPQGLPLDKSYDLIFSMAPPNDLMEWKGDVSRSVLWQYASFNVRSLLSKRKTTPEEVGRFLDRFRKVVWFETYFAFDGESNTVSEKEEELFKVLPETVKRHIMWWNDLMAKEARKKNVGADCNPESIKRAQQILDNISSSQHQFVNADCGMVACYLDDITPERCSVSFDPINFYTVVAPSSEGNVFVVRGKHRKLSLDLYRKFFSS